MNILFLTLCSTATPRITALRCCVVRGARFLRTPLFTLGATWLMLSAINAMSASTTVSYVEPKNPQMQDAAQLVRDAGILEGLALLVDQQYALTTPLRFQAQECGQVNAMYLPQYHAVVLCYELVGNIMDRMLQTARMQGHGLTKIQELQFGGALMFISLHEIGHALIDNFKIPVLGREEDVADQFAMFTVLRGNDAKNIVNMVRGALWFFQPSANHSRSQFEDSHALNEQRRANILCWTYGRDPSKFAVIGKRINPTRAAGCQREYQQFSSAMVRLLGPHTKAGGTK